MLGSVLDNGVMSVSFNVSHGTKEDCVLAVLLFSIFLSVMLLVAFKHCDIGVPTQFRTDGIIFNLRWLQAYIKVFSLVIWDLRFADDCAIVAHAQDSAQQLFNLSLVAHTQDSAQQLFDQSLVAHTQDSAQQLFDQFAQASSRLGLTVSLKKT